MNFSKKYLNRILEDTRDKMSQKEGVDPSLQSSFDEIATMFQDLIGEDKAALDKERLEAAARASEGCASGGCSSACCASCATPCANPIQPEEVEMESLANLSGGKAAEGAADEAAKPGADTARA